MSNVRDVGSPKIMRPMMFSLPIALLIVLTIPTLQKCYDMFLRFDPWIQSTIKISDVIGEDGQPMIYYSAKSSVCSKGSYSAWVETQGGARGPDGHESGIPYCNNLDKPQLWEFTTWLGNSNGIAPVGRTWRVCVSYYTGTSSGVFRASGPYCSAWKAPVG